MKIVTGARASPLSRAQVQEVQEMIGDRAELIPRWVVTTGDKDKQTSLRSLGKTNFFTKELDDMLLAGEIQIAIHSAKDLPDPLPRGFAIVGLTPCIDPRDSLVFAPGVHLPGAIVATSSERREQAVRALYPNVQFVDLRGTIHERLSLLERGSVQGVVVAEAALIRLKLTHLPRVFLPGETVPLQGVLAIVARADDRAMHDFISWTRP